MTEHDDGLCGCGHLHAPAAATHGGGDAFDSLLELEEDLQEAGREAGRATGRVVGFAEGHALGLGRGWAAGDELGFLGAAAEAVAAHRRLQLGLTDGACADASTASDDRVLKTAAAVVALCRAAPLRNPPPPPEGDDGAAGVGFDNDDSERPAAAATSSGGGSPVATGDDDDGEPDIFACLTAARAKFRLLTALARLPPGALVSDGAEWTGARERGF